MMKRSVIWIIATGMLTCAMLSCTESKVTPLSGSLVIFTEQDTGGEGHLMGVKDSEADTIVVPAKSYESISADAHFITCPKMEDGVKMYWIFRLNGESVGHFDQFTHWTYNGDYYLGTNYKRRYYYFPKTDVSLHTTQVYAEAVDLLLALDNSVWKSFTYCGELRMLIPQGAKVLHDTKTQQLYWLKEEQERIVLVNLESLKEAMSYSKRNWKLPASAEVQELDHLTVIRVRGI